MSKKCFHLQENTALREAMEGFSLSCGINSFVVNTKGKPVELQNSFCPLAKYQLPECKECLQHFRFGCLYSAYLRRSFPFFCPIGFLLLASPVIAGNQSRGAVIAGPFVTTGLKKTNVFPSLCRNARAEEIQALPVVQPKRVFALAKTLYYHIAYALHYNLSGDSKNISLFDALLKNFKSFSTNQKELVCFSKMQEKQLMGLIGKGDREKAEETIRMNLNHFLMICDRDFDMYRIHMLEYLMFLSDIASKNNAAPEQIFGMDYSSLNLLKEITATEPLQDWLEAVLQHFFDCMFSQNQVKHVSIIYNAIQYIQENYNQKIYLEDVAGMIYLNPSYFSRVFKDEMGVTFHHYLTNYRIEMSKNFLSDPSIPILSVAALVGFDDQSYFTKVFKRRNGVTPRVYRNQNQKTE